MYFVHSYITYNNNTLVVFIFILYFAVCISYLNSRLAGLLEEISFVK